MGRIERNLLELWFNLWVCLTHSPRPGDDSGYYSPRSYASSMVSADSFSGRGAPDDAEPAGTLTEDLKGDSPEASTRQVCMGCLSVPNSSCLHRLLCIPFVCIQASTFQMHIKLAELHTWRKRRRQPIYEECWRAQASIQQRIRALQAALPGLHKRLQQHLEPEQNAEIGDICSASDLGSGPLLDRLTGLEEAVDLLLAAQVK
jgi:hypothetical protein